MGIEFNHCLHNHESAYHFGGSKAVDAAIESCKLRALNDNFLCAHVDEKSASKRLKEKLSTMPGINSGSFILNIEWFQLLISFMDDAAVVVYYGNYDPITTKISIRDHKIYSQDHFFHSSVFKRTELQEILRIIENRDTEKGLNEGQKSRIIFLIRKLQGYIEGEVREICRNLGIDLDRI